MRKLFFVIPFILVGCTVTQRISYQVSKLPVTTQSTIIPILVDVRILNDNRAQEKENAVLFTDAHSTRINGKTMCINSEKHYKKDSVSAQMTRIMVEHFNKANLFKKAYCNKSSESGYYLTGSINYYYGEQGFSKAAAVGAQFGLLGALTTSGAKTPGKIIIDISDIKLFKNDGVLIKDLGDFYKEYKEDLSADAYCWCIYNNINEKLKDYNTHLVEKIRTDLANVKFD